ncbi:MAG TPA: hypothetical protein VF721_00975 [Pyrinomonadaceae bacterium]|jgi:hypothetical protein
MKICPQCNQTYADDSLNFCLTDGSVLTQASGAASGAMSEAPPTVLMNQPPPTNPNAPQFGTQAGNFGIVTPNAAQVPRPKSRAWLWVLAIFGGLILLCGGGFVALLALIPDTPTVSNYNYNSSGNNNGSQKSGSVLKDDLASWKPSNDVYGNTDYTGGELLMSSKEAGYYYVLVTPKSNFRTANATTRVKVRNTTGAETKYGFGLMIHSDLKTPLARDYSFLIDSDSRKFRVARHTDKEEKTVTDWTYSAAIKDGTQENVLEVKDEDGTMSFYINGALATTCVDKDGYKTGVVGLYSSDAVPVAFSGLEIRK